VNDRRTIALQKILQHERDGDVERARQLRRDQSGDASGVPSDEADIARSELDRNMLMNLAERSEERLKAIEGAFERLERGSYGECEQCGGEIPIERLRALPFASCCVECQQQREVGRRYLRETARPVNRWAPPALDTATDGEPRLAIVNDAPIREPDDSFADLYEENEMEPPGEVRPRRGRPPKNRSAAQP
jgi:RNA polymerase-binding protein DksA